MLPLCRSEDSTLICIDIQDSLLQQIAEPSRQRLLDNVEMLVRTAVIFEIPVNCTEKNPAEAGHTHAQISAVLPTTTRHHQKPNASCDCGEAFIDAIRSTHKRQTVVAGLESHICVLQTALELQEDGFEVLVVDDAVCSQRAAHWKSALDRLRQAGIIVAPTESILSEWLRDATAEQFRQVSSMLKNHLQ